MIQVTELLEDKQARDIQRRRRQEEERKKRIFDAKLRTFGCDVEGLQAQIDEKKRRLEEEKARERALEAGILAADRKLLELEQANEQEKREALAELLEFHKTAQKKTMRREYDLSASGESERDLPARIGDDDPRLSVSGIQKLEGEDLECAQREAMQREQQREWALAQMKEKEDRKRYEEALAMLEQQKKDVVDKRLREMDAQEQAERKEAHLSVLEENKRLAEERKAAAEEQKRREKEQEVEEIDRQLKSREMNEDMTLAVSASNPYRVRPDHFKGLFPNQIADIKATQRQQIEDARRIREDEEAARKAEERRAAVIGRKLVGFERQAERDKKEAQRLLLEENKRRAAEARERKRIQNEVYSNAVDESWFDKFNQSSR